MTRTPNRSRVRSSSRGRLGWWRAGLRALLCVIFPVGLFWSAVSRRRSVQDVVMRSVVVYDWHPLTADAVAALTTGRKARLGRSSDSGDA
jgi:hypothetical protein